jgi:hypothetical protein
VTSILPPELTTVNPCYTAINLISAAPWFTTVLHRSE